MKTSVTEFRMPSLGADMESGVLLEWLVHPGDTIHKGDIVAVVDTSKAAVEVECFTGGVVGKLLVEPGTRVPVGEVLAIIKAGEGGDGEVGGAAAGDEATPAGVVASPLVRRLAEQLHVDAAKVAGTGLGGRITHADIVHQATHPATSQQPHTPPPTPRPDEPGPKRLRAAPSEDRVKASPMARRLADELGVDLAEAAGSGPAGAITAEDVRRIAGRPPAPPSEPQVPAGAPQRTREDAMRKTIAGLMARSKREVPHYYLTEQIDLGTAMEWLHERNRTLAVRERLLPAVLLLGATARAAAQVPELNGFWMDDHFVGRDCVHLGVATSLRGGGLVAPAILDADRLGLPELMAALRDLVTRTRAGRLRGRELADSTITVSSLGDQGVESILGVIYPPQVALVGFGRIVDRPVAVGGLIGVHPVVTASLAADHRATDGATGARFLQVIASLLDHPEAL